MQPPGDKPWLLYGILGASLATNLIMAIWWPTCSGDCAQPTAVPAAPMAAPAAPEAGVVAPAVPAEPAAPTEGLAAAGDYQVFHGTVTENLARTFQGGVGEGADAIAAVYTREFVWDLDLRKDMQKGDLVTMIYRGAGSDVDMPFASLKSGKLGRELKAYRFQAPGDTHPSYWFPDGTEVPYRLKDGPLEQYIQITSLLDDRLGHKGWDLKADEGEPVHAPRAGRVERTNWSFAGNGNSVEVAQDDGVHAFYLHLSRTDVKPGDHVTKGQVIGLVGNTGHSTAPHLHYQVERNDRVIDPGEYHGTFRRTLPPEAMPAFQQEMARLDAMVGAGATPPAPAATATPAAP
jgi:murein DD-endopeptidase MepM/ murein hydrolase activator NlpD